jgi:hypothetical protein
MKGLGFLAILIPLIIVGAIGALYVTNFPITEVGGEKIGFADLINFFFSQAPPNVPEADVKSNPEISQWVSSMNGSELGDSARFISKLGNPIRFCVFKDYSYCQNFMIDGGKIYETSETSKKTVYVSYALALELKTRSETQNFEGFDKMLIQAVKSGDIKGITLDDVMNLGK